MMHLFGYSSLHLGFFGLPGGGEWIVLLVLGLLIFGRRLPEVGRSVGRSIVEFKRGIKDTEADIEEEASKPGSLPDSQPRRDLPAESAAATASSASPVEAVEVQRSDQPG